jgi:hypothetical protein
MAQFCTACGTPIEEGLRFCSQCGAAIASEEPTVADVSLKANAQPAVPNAAVPPPVPAPAPAPAAAKSSSPILKIVIIVVLFLVLLGALGIGTCAYMAYRAKKAIGENIQLNEDKKTIEIPTPGGSIRMGGTPAETPKEVGGVPVYPGAKATAGGGQFSFGDKFQIGGQEFTTTDSADQVVAFYRDKYGKEMTEVQSDGQYNLTINSGDQQHPQMVTINVQPEADSGGTKIVMSHIGGSKEAQ